MVSPSQPPFPPPPVASIDVPHYNAWRSDYSHRHPWWLFPVIVVAIVVAVLIFEQLIRFLWIFLRAPPPPPAVLPVLQLPVVIQMPPPEEVDPSAPPSPSSSLSTDAGLSVVPESLLR